jgi:acyl transferase domain-containing protein
MFRDGADSRINSTTIAQPAIMAIQIGLTAMLKGSGVEPHAVAGHSIGEVAAAYACGSLTLEQAICVIYQRSTIQARQAGTGGMLAAALSFEKGQALVEEVGGILSIAAVNGPEMLALAGSFEALRRAVRRLEEQESSIARSRSRFPIIPSSWPRSTTT